MPGPRWKSSSSCGSLHPWHQMTCVAFVYICVKVLGELFWRSSSGDSWSNTGFNWSSTQPSTSSPLGNPTYTAQDVDAKGARWPVYLTTTFNSSLLETYCLAQTGGVIDSSITPHGNDFVHQISTNFLPTYGSASSGNWTASSTLFIAFFGVNDVNLVMPFQNSSAYLDKIFASYSNSIEQVSVTMSNDEELEIFADVIVFAALWGWRTKYTLNERTANGSCPASITGNQASHNRCKISTSS